MRKFDGTGEVSRKRSKSRSSCSSAAETTRFVFASRSGFVSGSDRRKSTQYLITMEYHKVVDLLGIALPLLCALVLLHWARSILQSWRTSRENRKAEKNRQAGGQPRRPMVVPTVPPIERRRSPRTPAGAYWVDPDEPTVINLADRRRRS